MEIYKVAVTGIGSVLLAMLFRKSREDYAVCITLAAGILILYFAVGKLGEVAETVQILQDSLRLEESYIRILMKMLAVTYIAHFSAAICKDSGSSAVAGQIDLFARLTLAALGTPVFVALIKMITDALSV